MEMLQNLNPSLYPVIKGSDYAYNGIIVPRVTTILSAMLHEDGLMEWSNYIGLYKRLKYRDVLNEAAEKGTIVHNSIEDYITNSSVLKIDTIEPMYQSEVEMAYQSFIKWWDILALSHNVQVIMQEQQLVCQWFGGTLDLLISVDDKIYLIDFKTSNHLSYKYLLQLAAYRYMLRVIHGIEIDAVEVVRLDKNEVYYENFVLDLHTPEDLELMNHCEVCFASLVNGYYERKFIEENFKERMKMYDEW